MLNKRKGCSICPRACKQNGQEAYCGTTNQMQIAHIGLHFYEEPIISGQNGSGAVFFGGCNLRCVYCQNHEISTMLKFCKPFTPKELSQAFKTLEDNGAHNINLVTAGHFAPKVIEALDIYRPKIPIVYNTSSYEHTSILHRLKDYIDIYIADLKYFDNKISKDYSNCPDYFEKASQAILLMDKFRPKTVIENGLMKSGLIIRHLVLPTHQDDSKKVLDWISKSLPNATISLMRQYTPHGDISQFANLLRPTTDLEYLKVLTYARRLNLNGFSQQKQSISKDFIPIWGSFLQ